MIAPIDVNGIRIETERLILRPWKETDLEDLYAYASAEGVGEMAGWIHHKDKAESKTILKMFIEHRKTFALELKESGKVIGSLGLDDYDITEFCAENLSGREIGYVLGKDYWGRGLMPEAVSAVMEYCFTVLHYDFLLCGHFIWNDQSRRVVEKSGFQYVKDIVHDTRYDTVEQTKLYVCYHPALER